MKNKKKRSRVSRHHIICRSRGGDSSLENIAIVDGNLHQYYHILFDNRKPDEIIERLVNSYWNGNWNYVKMAYNKNINKKDKM